MTLHVFNPEHDLALANVTGEFTAPNNVRCLRAELGFLPALWAKSGDWILVNDVEFAKERLRHFKKQFPNYQFVDEKKLRKLFTSTDSDVVQQYSEMTIEPWGWDISLVKEMKRIGVSEKLLPTESQLSSIRELSGRQWAALNLLPCIKEHLHKQGFSHIVGEAFVVESIEMLPTLIRSYQKLVVKAPWSSSGRGVRYLINDIDPSTLGWCKNVIKNQGCITVEPYYSKVKDFGMEFMVSASGKISYEGLSIFKTAKSMYEGSLLATEDCKKKILSQWISPSLLDSITAAIISVMEPSLKGKYIGPFGVDMMLVSTHVDEALSLHPCVELNLRRTMGHVALSLTPSPLEPQQVMSVTHQKQYGLRFHTVWDDIINNGLI